MINERISGKLAYPSKFIEVKGSKIHYVEAGQGDPVLFLHGVPTSCYVWRNIIPYLAPLGRCIAPDLIGFGKSAKPDIDYSITDHIHYMNEFITALGLKNVTLVMHGWGSIIGFDYAMRHQQNIKGLAFYEAFLRPTNGDDVSLPFQEQINEIENEGAATDIVTNGISFIDKVLPQNVMRQLTEEEMTYYREPFIQSGAGKPILQYLKELPLHDVHNKAAEIIKSYSEKLTQSPLPKLMLYSVPGFITTIATLMWAKENLPNLEIVDLGEELHLAQESSPELMGEAISIWLQSVEQTRDSR